MSLLLRLRTLARLAVPTLVALFHLTATDERITSRSVRAGEASDGAWVCNGCEPGGGGVGGWNLYWHDPYECNSPCRCVLGDWICPGAEAPWIYGAVEFVPLRRDQLSSSVFQAQAFETVSGVTTTYPRQAVLTSDDLESSFDPGVRLMIGFRLGDAWRIEGGYMGSYSWSDSAEVRFTDDSSGNLLSPFSSFGDALGRPGLDTLSSADFQPVDGLDFNELARVAFTSQFNTAEINLRRRLPDISTRRVAAETSLLVGLRHIQVSESLAYTSESPVPAPTVRNAVDVLTENDLFGLQIGGTAQFLVGPQTWIDFEAKGAMLFGQAEKSVSAEFDEFGGALADVMGSEDVTAFLGDLSLQFNYQFAPSFTLKAGYNAFFLSGVALAGDNLNDRVTALQAGSTTVDHAGRIVYHGPSLGLVWAR